MRILAAFVILICLMFPGIARASHGIGGEISWECLGSGAYKFRLVFYRDCNGIPAPNGITLSTTVPGLGNITMPLVSQVDISYDGFQSYGLIPCLSCTNGGVPAPAPGLVEKNVYESAPVILNGIPPAQGWSFTWGECCRNIALTNLVNAGSVGFQYRAVMYPYNGQTANSCYDSSPVFAEEPMRSFCSGVPQEYSYFAYDYNGDSLSYEWAPVTDEVGNVVQYVSGFSGLIPLPGPVMNPQNINPVINPLNGMVNYHGFTGGYFTTKVKVTAYRCGIKISENYREIDVSINNNCPSISDPGGSGINLPPEMVPPFQFNTSFSDTVIAGELIERDLSWTDFQYFTSGIPQQIKVEFSGGTFGTNFMPGGVNCENGPCPEIINIMPVQSPIATLIKFAWQTAANHINYLGAGCDNPRSEYDLYFRACDNYCPANACATNAIKIVLLPDSIVLKAPVTRCTQVTGNDVTLQWTPTTSNDSLGLFESYLVYARPVNTSAWTLIDSIQGNINASSYIHTGPNISSVFGISPNTTGLQYRIVTRSGYFGGEESIPSNIISTMIPALTLLPSNMLRINFTQPSYPSALASHSLYYKIYREYPAGTWTFLDSTSNLTYVDSTSAAICNDSIHYRIELADQSGCINVSSRKGFYQNNASGNGIINNSTVICSGDTLVLSAINAQAYVWSTGQTIQQISVVTPGLYAVTVTLPGGCVLQDSVNVTSNGPVSVSITGTTTFCQGNISTLTATNGFTSYLWNIGAVSQAINVTAAGTYTVTVTDAAGCTGSASTQVTINPLPYFQITGDSSLCTGQSSMLNAGGSFSSYQWSTGTTTQVISISSPGIYTATVTNANGCTYSDSIEVIAAPPYTTLLVASGPIAFCAGDSVMLTANASMASYQWLKNNIPMAGSTQQTIWIKNPGNYKCQTVDASGCDGISNAMRVSVICFPPPPPVDRQNAVADGSPEIEIYPNPSSDSFFITYESGFSNEYLQIKIIDLLGREVKAEWTLQSETTILLNVFKAGTYFIRIQTAGASHIEKIIRL